MIVTSENFERCLEAIRGKPNLALDTETTGLKPYHDSELFSIIISDESEWWYFNFNEYPTHEKKLYTLETIHLKALGQVLSNPDLHFFMHNAKFDMAMLLKAGIEINGTVHDTMAIARVIDSERMKFSLNDCLKEIALEKDSKVEKYVSENKLWSVKEDGTKQYHYQLVPFDLIVPYAAIDATATFALGKSQIERLPEKSKEVYCNEIELTKTVFDMETRGVLLDTAFCREAVGHYQEIMKNAKDGFKEKTGKEFMDSLTLFKDVFKEETLTYGEVTATGKQNPKFDYAAMEKFKHPAARDVLLYRDAKKTIDYFENFIKLADQNEVLHANFNQHIPTTGRFSSSNPNLQNLTKSEEKDLEKKYLVRRAIIPRRGMVFHMLDYDQMEYRLMLEYAALWARGSEGVLSLIEKVKGGLDVHEATAEIAGITRKEAKTTNFALLYGAGNRSLAESLNCTEKKAEEIRGKIFAAAPEIKLFIKEAMRIATVRGWVHNWRGRVYSFPDSKYAYCAPNFIIQGGCADIVKIAMNRIAKAFANSKTKMVLTIHDELVLEGPKKEARTACSLAKLAMENVYPSKHLKLTVGIEHSEKSLADKVDGIYGSGTGSQILDQNKAEVGTTPELGLV